MRYEDIGWRWIACNRFDVREFACCGKRFVHWCLSLVGICNFHISVLPLARYYLTVSLSSHAKFESRGFADEAINYLDANTVVFSLFRSGTGK